MGICSDEVRAHASMLATFTRRWLGPGNESGHYPRSFYNDFDDLAEALTQHISHEERDIYPFIIKHLSTESAP